MNDSISQKGIIIGQSDLAKHKIYMTVIMYAFKSCVY